MPEQLVHTFDDLLNLILAPLEDRSTLCDLIRQRFEETRHDPEEYGDDVHALVGALEDCPPDWWLNPSLCRWWLCVCVDFKAPDQVEFQCQGMARTLNLEAGFKSDIEVRPCEVVEQLIGAAKWFRLRGYELVSLDTQGDDYVVVPVRLELMRQAFSILDGLGIRSSLY